jgi:hypothetical protein
MSEDPAHSLSERATAEITDLLQLGLLIADPVRQAAHDATVHTVRTSLERALELPAVKGPIDQAAQYAAQRIAASLAERTLTELITVAETNILAQAALGVTTTALGVAGQVADHPVARAARRFAIRNRFTRATTSTWANVTERAVATSLAQAAANVALDSVVDVVADVVMDVLLEVGPELAREIAEQSARQTAQDLAATTSAQLTRLSDTGPLPAAAVQWTTAAAHSPPVRLATGTALGLATAAARSDLTRATARRAGDLAAWAARTELGTAVTTTVEDTARAALRDRLKGTVRESVRIAWIRAIGTVLADQKASALPQDTMTRATRRITEMITAGPTRDAASGIAVKVTFKMAPSTVPRIAVSAARSTQNRAVKIVRGQ